MTNMSDDTEMKNRVRQAIGAVVFNASNYPAKMQTKVLGQDMNPLTEKLTLAVMGVLAEQDQLKGEPAKFAEAEGLISKQTTMIAFCGQVLYFGGFEVSRCILPEGHEGRHRNIFTDWD